MKRFVAKRTKSPLFRRQKRAISGHRKKAKERLKRAKMTIKDHNKMV
jgi:hypothetical protein